MLDTLGQVLKHTALTPLLVGFGGVFLLWLVPKVYIWFERSAKRG